MPNLHFYALLALLVLLILILTSFCRADSPPAEAPTVPPVPTPKFYTVHAFENGKQLDYWTKVTYPVVEDRGFTFTTMSYGGRDGRKVTIIGLNITLVIEENKP